MSRPEAHRYQRRLRLATASWAMAMLGVGMVWLVGEPVGNVLAGHDDPVAARAMGAVLVVTFTAGLAGLLTRRRVAAACWAMAAVSLPAAFGLPIVIIGEVVGEGGVGNLADLAVQSVSLGGAALAAVTGVAAWRVRRGRCPRCGGPHSWRPGRALRWPEPSSSPPALRRLVLLCACAFLPWGVLKQAWTWGYGWFGVDPATFDNVGTTGVARLLDALGIDLTVAAAVFAAVLMSAAVHLWFMRLFWWLAGALGTSSGDAVRRLGRGLLLTCSVIASTLVLYGIPVTGIGLLQVVGVMEPWTGEDMLPSSIQGPMILFGGFTFTGIGVGLAVGGRDFARRSAPSCAVSTAERETRWTVGADHP